MHYEIERKYLIEMPEERFLCEQKDCEIWEIEQIYLNAEPHVTHRIRRVAVNGETHYYQTFKRKVTLATAQESETEIPKEQYDELCTKRNPALQTILKRRYRIPFENHLLEIDIYPFWKKQAVLEIELESESEIARIPQWLRVIREVTEEKCYKNIALAKSIPQESV